MLVRSDRCILHFFFWSQVRPWRSGLSSILLCLPCEQVQSWQCPLVFFQSRFNRIFRLCATALQLLVYPTTWVDCIPNHLEMAKMLCGACCTDSNQTTVGLVESLEPLRDPYAAHASSGISMDDRDHASDAELLLVHQRCSSDAKVLLADVSVSTRELLEGIDAQTEELMSAISVIDAALEGDRASTPISQNLGPASRESKGKCKSR